MLFTFFPLTASICIKGLKRVQINKAIMKKFYTYYGKRSLNAAFRRDSPVAGNMS